MQINLLAHHYIGKLIIQYWLKKLRLASEDKHNPESGKFCCNSKNIKSPDGRAFTLLSYTGLFRRHCVRHCFLFYAGLRILSLSL